MKNTYLNLRAELKRAGITTDDVADLMGVSRFSYNSRLNNKTKWKLNEMLLIKDKINNKLGSNYSLEYLFKE